MVILGVVLLLAAPLLLLAALAVRFAGNRMLVLPVLAAGFGLAAFERPMLGWLGAAALVLAIVAVVVRIAAATDRFGPSGPSDRSRNA